MPTPLTLQALFSAGNVHAVPSLWREPPPPCLPGMALFILQDSAASPKCCPPPNPYYLPYAHSSRIFSILKVFEVSASWLRKHLKITRLYVSNVPSNLIINSLTKWHPMVLETWNRSWDEFWPWKYTFERCVQISTLGVVMLAGTIPYVSKKIDPYSVSIYCCINHHSVLTKVGKDTASPCRTYTIEEKHIEQLQLHVPPPKKCIIKWDTVRYKLWTCLHVAAGKSIEGDGSKQWDKVSWRRKEFKLSLEDNN